MEWSDEGIVLVLRRQGESSGVLSVFTREHGRHAGLVRGAQAQRRRGVLQPGNRVLVRWRGRLAEQLGSFECEPAGALAPRLLTDGERLAALTAACAVVETAAPEREPLPEVFEALAQLLAALAEDDSWRVAYVRWEVDLLAWLGYGLDLERCAISGARAPLAFVSPRTGRAVSPEAGAPWRDRLLPLPRFLVDASAAADPPAITAGLALTQHFLVRCVYAEPGRTLPEARLRLPGVLARAAATPAGPAGTE